MRDAILFTTLLGGIPFYLLNPFYGLLAFYLVSIMNPHRYTWGAAYSFPFAMCIAAATFAGILLGRERLRSVPKEREVLLIFILWIILILSCWNSLLPDLSWTAFSTASKVMVMTFLTMALCDGKERLRLLFWVIAISLGVVGFKGGLFGIMTGGGFKVWGPPQTFIHDNNDVGLAFNMALPIIYILARNEEKPLHRKMMHSLFGLTVLSTILTFSRGSFVTLVMLMSSLALMSRNKMRNMLILLLVGYAFTFFLSDAWTERMSTIDNAREDASFMGRVNAWESAWNMALDRPLTGGGLGVTNDHGVFARYAPDPSNFHAAHSIYFQFLGENGFPGFAVFFLLLLSLQVRLNAVRKKFKEIASHRWLSQYALAIQLSLLSFMVNGMTLSRAYFDLFFLVAAIAVMTISMARRAWQEVGDRATVAPGDFEAPICADRMLLWRQEQRDVGGSWEEGHGAHGACKDGSCQKGHETKWRQVPDKVAP